MSSIVGARDQGTVEERAAAIKISSSLRRAA
jgi:hypothetical protein